MLREHGHEDLVEIGRDTSREQAAQALAEADFVYHLAGINRPKTEAEFQEGNADFTDFVVEQLKGSGKKTPLVVSSSTQALQNNAYGQSKRAAEQSVERYGQECGAPFFLFIVFLTCSGNGVAQTTTHLLPLSVTTHSMT